jgi:uncharacterized protein
VIATYALLTVALVALWAGGDTDAPPRRRYVWILPFAASSVAALATGIVRPVGLVWIASLAGAAYCFARTDATRGQRTVACVAILLLSAGLMAHQLPGFNNPRVISATSLTGDAIPYRLHLNFDKTAVGLLLLGFCHQRITHFAQWREMIMLAAPIATGLIIVLLTAASVLGYVRFEPKFPRESWLWVWVNLCFTCVAEEALFRSFIQAQLQRRWQGLRGGGWLALGVAAILFGLAHAGGGPTYVVLATVAGVGYGWTYLRTGRIEASILTHFALNAVHFFGFTYPALQRAN